MRSNTDRKLMAPLAGAAIIAVIAIPASLLFVAATAGREDARREARFLSASFSGYLGSLATISQHELLAETWTAARPKPGQIVLLLDDRLQPISVQRGQDAPRRSTAALVRESQAAIAGLKAAAAIPGAEGSFATLSWEGDEASLVVAVRDPTRAAYVVGFKPMTSAFLNSAIGKRFELRDLRLHRLAPPRRTGYGSAPITVTDGLGTGIITWRSTGISAIIVRELLPVMGSAALILAALGVWLFRRTRRLMQEVLTGKAHASHLALHDPLTGLANRILLSDRLDLAIEQRRRHGGIIAVYVLNLDRFKRVNDSIGHAAGDKMLRLAAGRLLKICRATDTLARLGGDEFALIATVASADAAFSLAERLVAALSETVDVPGGQARLSTSVGMTLIEDARLDGADALRQADLALFQAKERGRGCYALFEPEMDESLRLRQQTEGDLRVALETGALKVEYQPQVTTRTGKLQGLEALIRWRHPDRGPVSPAYFIPIAEESGLIHELGEFVLRRACIDGLRWPDLKVAVNVSPCQLKTTGFPERCQKILEETGTRAGRIELEVTEGVLLDQGEEVLQTVRRLRDMGFTIALDDFGTGYSSLSYLSTYAVDKIKIDKSFVDRIGANQDAETVIRAIIRLGRALGLQVIAEGVETEAQRTELATAGCTLIQGYLSSPPVDAAHIDRLVRPGQVRLAA